jgi:hypothetical protein
MPFTSIGDGKYISPSGRVYSSAQVRAYYATKGWTKKVRGAMRRTKKKVDDIIKIKRRQKRGTRYA